MFVNRKKELEWLKQLSLALQNKKGINAALLGLRRVGKTELILEFRKQRNLNSLIMPYLNIQSLISSPKRFCLDFMHALLEEISCFKNISKEGFTDQAYQYGIYNKVVLWKGLDLFE